MIKSYICQNAEILQNSELGAPNTFGLIIRQQSTLTLKFKDMKLAKKLLILLIIMFGLNVFITKAQVPVDSVCAGTTGKNYYVTATSGSTYNWTVNGGTQASGGTSNSITIDFNGTSGVDTIMVQETDSNGCQADPVYLAVVRLDNPTASISGATTLCNADSAQITVNLTGAYPLTLTYNNGSSDVTVNNISSSTYQFYTGTLTATTSYSLVAIEDTNTCSDDPTDSVQVTVLPKPTTSQIFH